VKFELSCAHEPHLHTVPSEEVVWAQVVDQLGVRVRLE
jgi:hypothetical protein